MTSGPPRRDDGELWVCMSTMRHRRFVEDAVHIAGLPCGSRVRLRYARAYVSDELWERVRRRGPLPQVQILVTFAATDAAGQDCFAPLRIADAVGLKIEGSLLVVDCALGGFLVEQPVGSCWRELGLEMRNVPREFGSARRAEGWFVQRVGRAPGSGRFEDTVEAWERAATALLDLEARAHLTGVGRIPFLYLLRDLPGTVGRHLLSGGELEVEAGTTLEFDIHTLARPDQRRIDNPLGEVRLGLTGESVRFVSSRRVRVDSRRDVKRVRLEASPVFRRSHGHLSVQLVKFIHPGAERTGLPEGALTSDADAEDELTAAKDRKEVVLARYDFGLHIGRVLPLFASFLVAFAAAAAAFKAPASPAVLAAGDFVQPTIVFVIGFIGLALGFRGGKG